MEDRLCCITNRPLPDTIRQQIYRQQGPQWMHRQTGYVAADLAHLSQVHAEWQIDSLAACEALDWVQRALDLDYRTAINCSLPNF